MSRIIQSAVLLQLRSIFQTLEPFVQTQISAVKCSAHDLEHCIRVANTAVNLANDDTGFAGQLPVVYSAGLLHDIFDPKLFGAEALPSMKESIRKLLLVHLDTNSINDVVKIAHSVGYKYIIDPTKDRNGLPVEYQYVQDADLLDAIGAIGISRCMAYSGKVNRPLFQNDDSHASLEEAIDRAAYERRQADGTAVDHFYEKLLRIKDLILTESGKRVAQRRHDYMVGFLREMSHEINEARLSDEL